MESRDIRKTFSSSSERPSYGLPKPRAGTVDGPRGSVRALVQMYESKIKDNSSISEKEPSRNSSVGKLAEDKLKPYCSEFFSEDASKKPMRATVGPRSTREFLDYLDSDTPKKSEFNEVGEEEEEASIEVIREEAKKEVREFREDSYRNQKEIAMKKAREIQENKIEERSKDRKDIEYEENSEGEGDREKGRGNSGMQGDEERSRGLEKREDRYEDKEDTGRGRVPNKHQEKPFRETPGKYFKSKPANEVKLAEKISLKLSDLINDRGNEEISDSKICRETKLSTLAIQEDSNIVINKSEEYPINNESGASRYKKDSEEDKLEISEDIKKDLGDQRVLQSAKLTHRIMDSDMEIIVEGNAKSNTIPESLGLDCKNSEDLGCIPSSDPVKEIYGDSNQIVKEEIKLEQESLPDEKPSPDCIQRKKDSVQILNTISEEKALERSSQPLKSHDFANEDSSQARSTIESVKIADKEVITELSIETKNSAEYIKIDESVKEVNISPSEKTILHPIPSKIPISEPENPPSIPILTPNPKYSQNLSNPLPNPSNSLSLSLYPTSHPPPNSISAPLPPLTNPLTPPPPLSSRPAVSSKPAILTLSSLSPYKSPNEILEQPEAKSPSKKLLEIAEPAKNSLRNNPSPLLRPRLKLQLDLPDLARGLPREEDSLVNEVDILCVNCYECIPTEEVDSHSRVCTRPILDSIEPQTDMKIRKMLKAISLRKIRGNPANFRLYSDLEECSIAILESSMVFSI